MSSPLFFTAYVAQLHDRLMCLNMLAALLHRGHTVDSSQSLVHTAQIILCLLKLFCVFQFSSLKWLLPQLLTTQVLVIRGLFLCWSSNQT